MMRKKEGNKRNKSPPSKKRLYHDNKQYRDNRSISTSHKNEKSTKDKRSLTEHGEHTRSPLTESKKKSEMMVIYVINLQKKIILVILKLQNLETKLKRKNKHYDV